MTATPTASIWIWLAPALSALFLYGVGQGLVKKWIAEVPPARFCLYFVLAKAPTIIQTGVTYIRGGILTSSGAKYFFL